MARRWLVHTPDATTDALIAELRAMIADLGLFEISPPLIFNTSLRALSFLSAAMHRLAENGKEAPAPVARRQARRWMATRRPDVVSGPIQVRRSSQFTPARALPDSSGNA